VALAAGFALTSPAPVAAALYGPGEEPRLRIEVLSTLEYARYEVSGDAAQSPYRFLGGQGFGQVDTTAEARLGDWRLLRAQFRGVANGSGYRSPFDGIVVERLSVRYEDGALSAPVLAEAGDTFAYFSYRTLFRPLKGLQLELQPRLGSERRMSSLQFVLGSYASSWRDLDFDEDLSTAISWLVEDPRLGRWSLSWVHNRKAASEPGGDRPTQDAYSVAAEKTLYVGSETWRLEGEVGGLAGAPGPRPAGAPAGAADPGNGCVFIQLSGRGRSPLSYRLRFESYGEDYQPVGGTVYSDRRSVEAHAGWTLDRGAELRTRFQLYRDFRETRNPADTQAFGVNYSGRLPGRAFGGAATSIDFVLQDYDSRDGALDARLWTLQAEAYGSSAGGFVPRLGLFLQDRDDHTVREVDSRTFQIQVSGDRPLRWAGLRGTLSPGFLVRSIRDHASASNDLQPILSLPLYRGRHSLQQSLSYLRQDRLAAGALDVGTVAYRLLYRYARARDSFSFEVDTQGRNPDGARDTTSLRAAVAWTHRLERSSHGRDVVGVAPPVEAGAGAFDLATLRPGSDIESAREHLASAGLGPGSRIGPLTVYEVRLLPEIDERQRLVLLESDGRLEKAALIIAGGGPVAAWPVEQTFARVRDHLIGRYGRPSAFFEEGQFGGNLADQIGRGALVRIMEWYREFGVLRYGIPRRLDGQVRMELQIAAEFPSHGDPLWSIEEAR
jgi:hypothetical protein